MTREMVDSKIKELRELETMSKEINDQIDSIKSEIRQFMDDENVEVYYASDAVVRFKTINKSQFNSSAFRMTDPDTYSKFLVESSYKRLTIN